MAEVKFGVFAPNGCLLDLPDVKDGRVQYEYCVDAAKIIEKLGYSSLWLGDHFYPLRGAPKKALLEAFVLLSALASQTSKVGLGTMVVCNSFRQPSLLAKIASTLDVVSGGRLEFGIGAGYFEEEYVDYGYPFPKPSVRIGMMREAIQILKKLWTEEKSTFTGKYYSLREAVCEPKPVQKPYPPILIGGGGEQLTLKVVARLGDKCNFHARLGPEGLERKLEILKKHCSAVGRNYEEIEKTCRVDVLFAGSRAEAEEAFNKIRRTGRPVNPETILSGDIDHCVKKLKEIVNVGFTYLIVEFPQFDGNNLENSLKTFSSEVIPSLMPA